MSVMMRMRTSLRTMPQAKIVKNQAITNSFAYSGLSKMKSFRASPLFSSSEYSLPLMSYRTAVMIMDKIQNRKMRTRPTTLHHRNLSKRAGRTYLLRFGGSFFCVSSTSLSSSP